MGVRAIANANRRSTPMEVSAMRISGPVHRPDVQKEDDASRETNSALLYSHPALAAVPAMAGDDTRAVATSAPG